MNRRCSEARLAALSGAGVPPAEHARVCAPCAEERALVEHLRALDAELPLPRPRAARVHEIRDTLAALPPRDTGLGRRRVLAAAAGAAALIALAIGVRSSLEPPVRAAVEATPGARFEHVRGGGGHAERVRLAGGTIRLEVDRLREGERMIVSTTDAEVEVRGTVFEVSAEDGRLRSVRVHHGAVELRRAGEPPRTLAAGTTWSHDQVAARAAPTGAPDGASAPDAPQPPSEPDPEPASASPSDAREASPRPSPAHERASQPAYERASRSSSDARRARPQPAHERAFRDAWAASARGEHDAAAELFAEARRLAPDAALAEDAAYGRAVALERAGRRASAIAEMERFLEHHPRSDRAGEVAAALGWLLLDAGEHAAAKRHFEEAAKSGVRRVRESAERGLRALAQR